MPLAYPVLGNMLAHIVDYTTIVLPPAQESVGGLRKQPLSSGVNHRAMFALRSFSSCRSTERWQRASFSQ